MGAMKLRLAVAFLLFTTALVGVSCGAGPGCYERPTRNGDVLIECR